MASFRHISSSLGVQTASQLPRHSVFSPYSLNASLSSDNILLRGQLEAHRIPSESLFNTRQKLVRIGRSSISKASGEGGESGPPGSDDKFKEAVSGIETYLGTIFGSALWFTILTVTIAIFGGGYVYLLLNFADFSDIPILNGPQGIR